MLHACSRDESTVSLLQRRVWLDWLHQVKYLSSSWVERFLNASRVELRSWTQALKLSWEAWFDNSIRKFNSTQQDIR